VRRIWWLAQSKNVWGLGRAVHLPLLGTSSAALGNMNVTWISKPTRLTSLHASANFSDA